MSAAARRAVTFALVTPPPAQTGGSAIGVVQLTGGDGASLDSALDAVCGATPRPGEMRLRRIFDADDALVVRISETTAQLTVHGGIAVVRAVLDGLAGAGLTPARDARPRERYPEAGSHEEACMLDAIARARSPRALDALLAQPDLWRATRERSSNVEPDRSLSAELMRLIDPPLVAAVGAPNIGKSTLLNALARRAVALVADIPGTTRDHVGAELLLDGVCVRWVDTPGIGGHAGEQADAGALALARRVIAGADLIVHCADAASCFADLQGMGISTDPPAGVLRCALRADLGEAAGADSATSALDGRGIDELAAAVRRRLVSDAALARAEREAWRFHAALVGG